MNMTSHRAAVAAGLLLLTVACSKSPVTPSGSVTVTAPLMNAPANGAFIANLSQPVTLGVTNGLVSDSGVGATVLFEVASDAGFSSKVQTKEVPAGVGQTSVKLDALPAGRDYFWHVSTNAGGTVGAFSAAARFTIGPAIVVGAPTPISPLTGATSIGWPTLIVGNAGRSGPVTSLVYRFEISTTAGFTSVIASGNVSEGANDTRFTPPASPAPPTQTALFWRATVTDQGSGAAGAPSLAQTFSAQAATPQSQIAAQLGYVLWPGQQPPGTTGQARMGPGWEPGQRRSFDGVLFTSPPLEILQVFDLIDRGMDPASAIEWMNTHGYPNTAFWVPQVLAIGFPFQYMALVQGAWELVHRTGA